MVWLIDRAKKTVRISQQDLVTGKASIPLGINRQLIGALARALDRDVDVFIILSNVGAPDYSADIPFDNIARVIRDAMSGTDVGMKNLRLERFLHIAPVAVALGSRPSVKWQDLTPVSNHAKFYMIDDSVFYIGSHNMYAPLETPKGIVGANQEFGYIVEDAGAARTLLEKWWNRRWTLAAPFQVKNLGALTAAGWSLNVVSSPIVDDRDAEPKCTAACSLLGSFRWNETWYWFGGGSTKSSWCQCTPAS